MVRILLLILVGLESWRVAAWSFHVLHKHMLARSSMGRFTGFQLQDGMTQQAARRRFDRMRDEEALRYLDEGVLVEELARRAEAVS